MRDLKKTVLVVDDVEQIRNAVADALRDEGYQVFKAANGAEALAHALANPPDAIVSNILMPRLDGIGLASELRRRGLRIPMVLMSATNEIPGVPGLLFVSKPFEMDHLVAVVERVIMDE